MEKPQPGNPQRSLADELVGNEVTYKKLKEDVKKT